MNLKQCEHGHFYDANLNKTCPYCGAERIKADIPARFRQLGEVSFLKTGSVSSVFRIGGENVYALKLIECGTDEAKYRNAMYELRIMEKVNNLPCAVKLRDCEITEERGEKIVYLLEEYHTSLSDYLLSGTVFAADAVRIALELCDAVIALKKRGILHLDIQPENIFVDGGGKIKLGDFSSSLFEEDVSSNHRMRGTLGYMAPEVYREGLCGERSEQYSLGLVIYRLFNGGALPFTELNNKETAILMRLAGTPLPDLSYRKNKAAELMLNGLVRQACAFNAAERYPDTAALKSALLLVAELFERYPSANEALPFFSGKKSTPDDAADTDRTEINGYTWFDERRFDIMRKEVDPIFGSVDPTTRTVSLFDADPDRYSAALFPKDTLAPASGFPVCGVCKRAVMRGAVFCPYCGTMLAAGTPAVEADKVEFSAVAPAALEKGKYSIISVVMYEENARHIVDEMLRSAGNAARETRSGIKTVSGGARIKVVLRSQDIEIADDTETGVWRGGHLVFSFDILLPENYKKSQVLFTANVYVDDVIISRLKFIAECTSPTEQKMAITRQDVLSAFVSYASEDRKRVASIVQGMKKARPDMDIFFDVASLRSGEHWEKVLRREIENRDVLFLFWSRHALESEWVNKEWEYAYERNGIDSIEPVPIESPEKCPPPDKLSGLHFNDTLLFIIDAN